MQTPNYLPQFQGLRATAFMSIFASHLLGLNALGILGVSIFFTLSGFLMVFNYWLKEEPSFGIRFSYQKIKKLYPLHIATMFCHVVISIYSILCGSGEVKKLILDIALNASLTQAWIPSLRYYFSLNGVSWYLCVCAFIYFCFPLVFRQIKRIKNNTQALMSILLLLLLKILVSVFSFYFGNINPRAVFSVHWITYICPVTRLIDFLIGCCLAYIYLHTKKATLNKAMMSCVEIGIILLIVGSCFIDTYEIKFLGSEFTRYTLLYVPATSALIWVTARKTGWISKLLSMKLLIKIGDICPYAFLIHGVVIDCCKLLLNELHMSNLYILSVSSIILTFVLTQVWIIITNKISLRTFKI